MKWRLTLLVIIMLTVGCTSNRLPVLTLDDVLGMRTDEEFPNLEGRLFQLQGMVESVSEKHNAYRVNLANGYMDIHNPRNLPTVGTSIDEVVTIYDFLFSSEYTFYARGYETEEVK